MHLLLIGDPHFRVDNISETQKFIRSVVDVAKKLVDQNRLDHIVVLGDILHTHEKLNTHALNIACDFFEAIRKICHVFCLVGNHDATSNTIFLEDTHWMNALKRWHNLTIVDVPTKISGAEVIMCPYVPDGRFIEALSLHFPQWKNSRLIIGHQLLNGAKMGAITASNVEEWEADWPMCISGHIHDKQLVKPNLFYTGSSMQHAFGESHDKTLCLIDTQTLQREEIELDIPKKKILYVDADDVESLPEKIKNEVNVQYKIVVRGDAATCKAVKNSTVLKGLRTNKAIKSIQLKEISAPVDNEKKNEKAPAGFHTALREIIARRKDPFVESLLNHCLGMGDDLSDKPAFTV